MRIRNLTSTMEKKRFNQIFNRYKVLKKIIKNPIVIDVGANEGQTIIEITKKFKKAKIHSFEPNIALKNKLIYVKKKYQNIFNIKINMLAVGDKKKNINFYLNKESSINSPLKVNFNSKLHIRMAKLKNSSQFRKETNIKTSVKQTTLDIYCRKNKIKKVDLLKSDTQGYDKQVLLGAKKILPKISVVLLEMNFYDFYEKKNSFYEFEKILKKNFILWDISMLYKNPRWGSIDWADVMYINKKIYNQILKI